MSDIASVFSIATAGLQRSTARFEASAERVAGDPHADLAAELVEQRLAALDFRANVAVLKTANELAKSLLDIFV